MSIQSSKEDNETDSKDSSARSSEGLMVYIRVRPKLKNEYLKEIATFIDSNVTLYTL